MRIECREYELLPAWWYGHAYRRWEANVSVYYPIPINYFVRWGMALSYIWNSFRSRSSWVDEQVLFRFNKEMEFYEETRRQLLDKELWVDEYLRRAERAILKAESNNE